MREIKVSVAIKSREDHDHHYFFIQHIQKYNKSEQYYNHYVKFGNDKVMIITWEKGRWDYITCDLEGE